MPEKTIKVAYLLGSVDRGGAETLLLDCFHNSSGAGFDFIGVHRKDGSLLSNFKETGVPFYKVGFSYKFDLSYFFRLRKLLLSKSVTIVHAQQPVDALFARIATKGTGIRLVLTMHGYDFNEGLISRAINRYILTRTSLNIYVSNAQRRFYLKKYSLKNPSRQKVVYNGISLSKLDNTSEGFFRNELRISNHTLLLCSVGNFVPGRDQLTICRFLVLLKEKNIDFRMVFAGAKVNRTPNLYDDCVNFCSKEGLLDRVTFLGSRTDVPDILAQSDAFIYASDNDTFGLAVIEAIAAGIPVFVNDWEALKEVTRDGKYAYLYKTKDEYHLFARFQKFLENPEAFKIRAAESALLVRESFSLDKHLHSLNNAYCNLD